MRPILEYLVPRQKLVVFAGMAQQHLESLGPNADVHAVRDAMAKPPTPLRTGWAR